MWQSFKPPTQDYSWLTQAGQSIGNGSRANDIATKHIQAALGPESQMGWAMGTKVNQPNFLQGLLSLGSLFGQGGGIPFRPQPTNREVLAKGVTGPQVNVRPSR